MAPMRHLLILCLLMVLLAACAGAPPPPAPAESPPTAIPLLRDLPDRVSGPVMVIGLLYITQDGGLLVDGLSLSAATPLPTGAGPIWLGALRLPADPPLTDYGAARYGPAQIAGQLEGPGAYGPQGRYRYQIGAPQVELLSVRELDIPLLLSNSGLYERQAIHLSGQLLVSADSALLSERLGQGGVPDATARQVKLAAPLDDQTLIDRLAGAGAARYGPVQILGLWRDGTLVPLVVTLR